MSLFRSALPRTLHSVRPLSCQQVRLATSSCGAPASKIIPSDEPIYLAHIPHLVPYKLGLALQEDLYKLRGDPNVLLLLQHTPVYTEGRRGFQQDQPEQVPGVSPEEAFRKIGADYVATQRGGLITYHGPGQLVGYPILHLGRLGLSNRCYVDKLQSALAAVLHSYSIPTVDPPDGNTGVWTDSNNKIVSIGVQVRHRVTTHGFALNVTPDVTPWFKRIVACGIQGKSVTNMQTAWAQAIEQEEAQRPDREAASAGDSPDEQRRRDDVTLQPGETPPELGRVTVENLAPQVAKALAKQFQRPLLDVNEYPEGLLRFEADDKNVLQRAWVKGNEVIV